MTPNVWTVVQYEYKDFNENVCLQFSLCVISEQTVTVYVELLYMSIVCFILSISASSWKDQLYFVHLLFFLVVYSQILTLKANCGMHRMQRFLADTLRAQTNTEMEVF